MRDFLADHLCMITPLRRQEKVRRSGEATGRHQAPLTPPAAGSAERANEITVDLTGVDDLSHDALAALIALARALHPPQTLCLVARPRLLLHLRLRQRGWEESAALRLRIPRAGKAGGAGGAGPSS
ncbi:hypothetical protein [Streptomyces sp. NPDC046939]|uniref:hypothetical protein n=1 Tax=Streptomyces sp. NPDC046939 TaxID=3155376 RepID=UPI0033F42106